MISNVDPVELEYVLRPTIYRPAGNEPERAGMERPSVDKAVPSSDGNARLSVADRLSASRL